MQTLKQISDRSPFLLFLPFLFFFLCLVWLLDDYRIIGDEVRYLKFANNLLNGFYSPPPPNINLWSGPGYPLFLAPLVALNLPFTFITALNAVFYYVTLVFLFKSLQTFLSFQKSFAISSVFAFYYITYQEIGAVLTEHFTLMFCSILLYVCVGVSQGRKKVFLGGLILGYMALTKVMFGYVILGLIFLSVLLAYGFRRNKMKGYIYLCLIAFVVNLPYLTYTYKLTGKPIYWSNAGGMVLYWMSTPHRGEFGDWHDVRFLSDCGAVDYIPCNRDKLSANHQTEIDHIESLPIVERDDAYKKLAIRNIRQHPFKFLRNCVANISRLFFDIPKSFYYQMDISIIYILPNGVLMTCMLLALFLSLKYLKKLEDDLLFIILLIFSYLGLSTLGSAYMRFLYVIMPFILYWLAFIFERTISVKRWE